MPIAPIVSPAWLEEHRHDVVLADVRWALKGPPGREEYLRGHLPGAVFIDLDRDLSEPPSPAKGRHPLPTPEHFAEAMSAAGIGDDDVVIAYDAAGGASAARLVWMLRVTGHEAALLDGGLAALEGGALSGGAVTRPRARFSARPFPADAIVDKDDVAAAVGAGGVVLDARARERFRGDVEPVDPRPGHIPGAKSAPFAGNLDEQKRFLDAGALRNRYVALGVDARTIVMCGSGVNACHDALAIEHAGLPRPKVFVGSWSAWSSDPTRPAALGD